MEEILERLKFLEKRVAILEKREQSNCNNFKETIVGIQLTAVSYTHLRAHET
jgi:hypothetical protein